MHKINFKKRLKHWALPYREWTALHTQLEAEVGDEGKFYFVFLMGKKWADFDADEKEPVKREREC